MQDITEEQKAERELEQKNWDDITDPQKIERLRKVIKELTARVGREASHANGSRRMLDQHSHNETGEVVIPIKSNYDQGMGEVSCDKSSRVYI